MSFRLATWNVLATAYIKPQFYPHTPHRFLDNAWRVPALVERARSLDADVLCLQEVEESVFAALERALPDFRGLLALKGGHRPDGCATFFRSARFELVSGRRLAYADGSDRPASGHVAQVLILELEKRRLQILNTHLKWDAPDTPRQEQWGYRQVLLGIEALRQERDPGAGQIVCGDLNVTPDSDVVEALTGAGFKYAHRGLDDVYTCNSNGIARLIDYVFYRGPLVAEPLLPAAIGNHTPLPSLEQPSDHLPLLTGFEWQATGEDGLPPQARK